MNIKALLTTLVLGSSSMASADSLTLHGSVSVSLGNTARPARPVVIQDDCAPVQSAPYRPASSRPVYQPTRPVVVQPVWQAPVYRPTNTIIGASASQYKGSIASQRQYFAASNAWYDLSEATRIDSGREFFTIGANKGVFRGLRLEALGNGRSNIKQVVIEFADGQTKTQVVRSDSWIGRGNTSLTIDLDGNARQISRVIVYGSTDVGSAYKLMVL
jgi:hypothetical protein